VPFLTSSSDVFEGGGPGMNRRYACTLTPGAASAGRTRQTARFRGERGPAPLNS
jgi:hypothetical protein